MKNLLLILFSLLMSLGIISAQINENFETGTASLNWEALNGTWSGVVNNPAPNRVNNTSKVGRYIKKDSTAYSLFWAKFATPLNLATNNKFTIDVYSKKAGIFIFKVEGPRGAREVSRQVVLANNWQNYTIDLYGARAVDSLNRLILFFDAGVGNSKNDTFYFDNLRQLPADACSGVVANVSIVDDFECQRNANYVNGWDSISVVNNPDPTGLNTSAKVARYGDPITEQWAAIVHNNLNGMDLRVNNYMRVKVWAAKTGTLLLKLEDGAAAVERPVQITAADLNKWVEFGADFSAVAFNNYKKAVMFFNAGVTPTAGDVYYFDDWQFTEKPALEDFDPIAKMVWQPGGGNASLNGTIETAVANPRPNPINSTPKVGKYTKGTAAFASFSGILPVGFKVDSLQPQLNLMVLTPTGSAGKKVAIQLVSGTQGNITGEATIDSAGVWNELKFDMSAAKNVNDISSMNILFNAGTAEQGAIYYFDQLRQSRLTLNPCVGVVPNTLILDNFECQRNATYGAGSNRLTVVSNPNPSAVNSSTGVGRYADPADEWSALVITRPTALDLSQYNQLSLKIWSPKTNVRMLYKLEGGTTAAREVFDTIRTANAWVSYQIDLSRFKAENHRNVAIFFNAGIANAGTDVYFMDDIEWKSEPISGCALDFENTLKSADFQYFGADTLDGKKTRVVDNPRKMGINTSNKVVEHKRLTAGQVWQGAWADLPAPMKWQAGSRITVKAKVLMNRIGNFAVKLEGSPSGPNNVEIPVANTRTNEWEEITIDFTGRGTPPITGNEGYKRLTIFFDLSLPLPTAVQTSYLDDIVIGTGACGTTGIFNPTIVEKMTVYPNPVHTELTIRYAENMRRIEITNMLGQRVKILKLSQAFDNLSLSLDGLDRGLYIINAYGDYSLISTGKFVKE
jgi:hypothetical protein